MNKENCALKMVDEIILVFTVFSQFILNLVSPIYNSLLARKTESLLVLWHIFKFLQCYKKDQR